jgi:hypothetical protein
MSSVASWKPPFKEIEDSAKAVIQDTVEKIFTDDLHPDDKKDLQEIAKGS